jgi:hypothetical protein
VIVNQAGVINVVQHLYVHKVVLLVKVHVFYLILVNVCKGIVAMIVAQLYVIKNVYLVKVIVHPQIIVLVDQIIKVYNVK